MRIKLGMPMSLSDISFAVKGKLLYDKNEIITHICTDSREVISKDLFIPLNGPQYNGEDFVDNVIAKNGYALSLYNPRATILVNNSLNSLMNLARFYNEILPYILYRVGITGSVGKTTSKEFLKKIMSVKYKVHANEENLNNEIGLPLTLLSAPKDTEIIIAEMGMNHTGEISRLSKCLSPNIGIITNIGTSHIGNLGSRKAISKAKLEMLDGMKSKTLLLPSNEPLLSEIEGAYYFSTKNSFSDFHLEYNFGKVKID